MIDHLRLQQLDHPSKAHPKANLQMVLVFDVLRDSDKAMLVETRSGECWLPRKHVYYAPESGHARGVIVYIPMWLATDKSGALSNR